MAQNLRHADLTELFRRQVVDAQETSHNLGETLPVTLKLPKKTVTPGALDRARRSLVPQDPQTKGLPEADLFA